MQEQKVKEAGYCALDILPAQYFLQAGAADIRCIYLRHSAQETIFTESRDKEPRFVRRTAIINYRADVTLSVSSIRRNDNIRVVQPRAPRREKFTKLRELCENKRYARAGHAAFFFPQDLREKNNNILIIWKIKTDNRYVRIYDVKLHCRFIKGQPRKNNTLQNKCSRKRRCVSRGLLICETSCYYLTNVDRFCCLRR